MLQGVYHQPYGFDNLYSTESTERFPRDPMAGDTVLINARTWPVEPGQTVWITWTKNGVAQPAIGAQWTYDSQNTSYWQANLGQFARGDSIEYYVHANENQANEQVVGPFSFNVTSWSTVTNVSGYKDNGTSVDIHVGDSAGSFTPIIRIAFPTADSFHLQFAPSGNGLSIQEQKLYTVADSNDTLTIATSALVIKIQKTPYRLSVYQADGTTLITQQYDPSIFRNLGWASDGKSIITRVEDHYQTQAGERFHGFGECYDYFDQRGRDVTTYIYNEYVDQAATDRTYLSVPFFINSAGYGIYIPSTAYSVFNIGTFRNDMVGFTVNATNKLNSTLEYYFFAGTPKTILDRYTSISGRPQLPPKWAFGLWLSANEWNNQAQVTSNLDLANQNQIPVTVLVLEQWSDEATFYIWHGAQYVPKPDSAVFSYSDFTFPPGGDWQDPRAMVADAHNRGVRIVLWQSPFFKEHFVASPTPHFPASAPQQHLNDKKYAVAQGYMVTDGSHKPYRVPAHRWFSNSMLLDFTNKAAAAWWMSKRAYLINEVGIDGFKDDGGESVFGRDTTFADGRKGDIIMHNGYPLVYIGAYNQYIHSSRLGSEGALFSRAGTAGSQTMSIFWAGDQYSSFDAFQQAIRAGLSTGQSGLPFWSWDLAGFTGPVPSSELYLRAAAMATFCPVMQLHSEYIKPPDSRARTPWHVQEVTGDPQVIPVFRKFANVRMNLLPYIYSEAKRSSMTGTPMMRAMNLEFPEDPGTATLEQQYMFGEQFLVAPVVAQGATTKDVYVPKGQWYDLWNSAQFSGPGTKSYGVSLDLIPVYARPGAIVPLNLNPDYELGGPISNSVAQYANLTFRIYPAGYSIYDYYDANDVLATIQVNESWASHQVTVVVPKLSTAVTLQIIAGSPSGVTADGAALTGYTTLADLKSATAGWYWDPTLQTVMVKLQASDKPRTITLNGVDKAAYQAEFASGVGTGTNTNHANYTGLGFVDGFDQVGDSVTFSVNADSSGDYWLRFRYANALGMAATRNIYVDGTAVGTLTMPALADWDTWSSADIATTLSQGQHQIQIKYDPGNNVPINLDGFSMVCKTASSVSVPTQHNDNNRTGANLQETVLNTSNVNPEQFGQLFMYPVPGHVYAQPLYVSNVSIPGKGTHNVVYVATMNNRVYAFDADDRLQATTPLWQRQLEPSIPLPDPNIGSTYIDPSHHDTGLAVDPTTNQPVYRDISQEVGIVSTPVISLTHNAIYLVTSSKDPNSKDPSAYSHHLHALDLATGGEKFGGPVKIQASFKGQGYTSVHGESDTVVNGEIQFISHRQLQRAGLLLGNDTLHIAFASYGDKDVYHGWVPGYSASTLQQTAVFNTTPSGVPQGGNPRDVGEGGIWQAGAGLAADEQNNIYLMTGNGGYRDGTDFSDCFLKLRGTDLTVLDWFAPFNQQQLAERDIDVGSAGPLLIPGTDLLIGGGKESKFFLMQRDQMGHFDLAAGNGQIVQHFYIHAPEFLNDPLRRAGRTDGSGHHVHGAPVYWQGPQGTWIYIWVEEDVVKAFELLLGGKFQTTPLSVKGIPNAQLGVPASQGSQTGLGQVPGKSPGMPGGMVSISANGSAPGTGILWASHPLANAVHGVVPGIVRAYDASDLSKELWNSKVNAARDDLGNYAKFSAPTIANGKVYIATFSGRVAVYGPMATT